MVTKEIRTYALSIDQLIKNPYERLLNDHTLQRWAANTLCRCPSYCTNYPVSLDFSSVDLSQVMSERYEQDRAVILLDSSATYQIIHKLLLCMFFLGTELLLKVSGVSSFFRRRPAFYK